MVRRGRQLASGAILTDVLATVRRGQQGVSAVTPETFRLTIDYSQSLGAMIAAGCYDWKSDNITAKRYPVEGQGVIEYEGHLFHFNRNTDSKANIKAIESADPGNPWSVSEIEHLLAFGEKFPEEQRKHPIIALGSVAKVYGYRYVPVLNRVGSKRGLGLSWFDGVRNPFYRFLAVRKVSGS